MAAATRRSVGLTTAQIQRLWRGHLHAQQTDRKLGVLLTVHWHEAPNDGTTVQRQQRRLLERANKWFKRRGIEPAWLWTIEDGLTSDKSGHSHILLHLPTKHQDAFADALVGWTGQPRSSEPQGKNVIAAAEPEDMGTSMWQLKRCYGSPTAALRYIVKAIAPQDQEYIYFAYHLQGTRSNRSLVVGQRCGQSQSLGKTAINRWDSA